MKIIVTGGTGGVGHFTAEILHEAGHSVCSLDQNRSKRLSAGIQQITTQLTDAGEVYDAFARFRPDAVCHIGANPSPSDSARQSTFQNNVQSTYTVYQAAGDFGVKRFIYASSEMATGWLTSPNLPPQIPFTEEDRVDSPNAYALSKYMGEVIGDSMILRYPEMTVVSLRINNVILPDNYQVLEERRKDFMNQGHWNFWSYIDVRDVARAFHTVVEGSSSGHEVYLIAAADTCIDIPLAEALKKRFGAAPMRDGAGPSESAFDCSKIKRDFGWEPIYSWRTKE